MVNIMLCIYENCEYQVNKLNNESHCVAVVLRASAGSDILLYSLVLCLLKCSLYSMKGTTCWKLTKLDAEV